MDDRRARIHDDLRGLIAGDLLFDPVARAPYAHDASLYEIDPLGVVVPRTDEDVESLARYATERGLALHARGAGTGLAGESLGPGLVIDFSRYLRRIIRIDADRVVAQPGAVLGQIAAKLAPLGRRIGPDPSGQSVSTVGGFVASDSAGARSLRSGTAADVVESLQVVFANGECAELAPEPWPETDRDPTDFKASVLRRVALHLDWHRDLIESGRGKSPRNRAGYALHAIGDGRVINLARLIVGSEGTLALVTRATLRTEPIPRYQAVVLLPFGRMMDAASAVAEVARTGPAACEMYDWRRLTLAREADAELRSLLPDSAESALIVLYEGDAPSEVMGTARSLAQAMRLRRGLAGPPHVTQRPAECRLLMGLRELVQPLLLRASGPSRPVPLIEDIAVPPEALVEFLTQAQGALKSFGVHWIFHAHAAVGQTHIRPFLDLSDPNDRAKLGPLAAKMYEAALALGGTISGEHGCGLVRSQFLRRQYGDLMQVFREIKYAFDPQNLLNPGKIVGTEPDQIGRDLRHRIVTAGPADDDATATATATALPVLSFPLNWTDQERASQVMACHGCGECRSVEPMMRMCPTFRGLRAEAATPRAHANLLRQIATGVVDPRKWGSEELRSHAELCVHCDLCRDECPAGIDVSLLMLEAKAAAVENHGLTPSGWLLSHMDVWARWSSRLPVLGNLMLRSQTARRLLERSFGLSRHRVMPRAQRFSFLRRADRLGVTRPRPNLPGPRVAYFVDLFANHFDPELAETAVSLLLRAGVNVYVPSRQRGSGMASLVVGDLDRTRHLVAANLRILGNAVRDGYTVVCSEPTATLMLTRLAPKLTDDLDAALVAERTMDLGQYLKGLDARGGLPEPTVPIPARAGYHQPCHLKALNIGTPGLDLVRAIPGLEVEFIDRGCSGIAGVFGLARKNFRTSLRSGRDLRSRLKDPDIQFGVTECGTCRMQMEQGLTKRTVHPIKLLAIAHGMLPELRATLTAPKPRHEMS